MHDYSLIADGAQKIAEEAGHILMRYFRNNVEVTYKSDESPVTEADIQSSRYIEKALAELTPDIPVVSEECEIKPTNADTFWLVDPLDGTRAFVGGVPEFAVCIGLVHHHEAVLGILNVPATGDSYVGGQGVPAIKILKDGTRQPIQTRISGPDNWTVIKSAVHASDKLDGFLEPYPVSRAIGMSSAVKFGVVAEGGADLYPRLGKTMEWDTAAGQAIVEAAGGHMQTLDGNPFLYGKAGFLNSGFIVFANKP